MNVLENVAIGVENSQLRNSQCSRIIQSNDISIDVVQKAINHMKNNKSLGYDGLPSEIFKYGLNACV